MLREIKLKNFQSHRHSVLPLQPGLNVITGPSDTGKSAIVRAFKWLALHEPISGLMTNGESEMSVRVIADGPNVIERFKDAREYGYRLNDLGKFLACARDQPLPISTVLNLTPENFQSQFSPHYLLSLTPGQVAREINRVIALTDIDRAISWLKERSKANNILLEATEQEIKGLEDYLEANSNVPKMGTLLELLKGENTAIERYSRERGDLSQMVDEINHLRKVYMTENRKSDACEAARLEGQSLCLTKATKQGLESIVAESKAIEAMPHLFAAETLLMRAATHRRSAMGLLDAIGDLAACNSEIFLDNSKMSDTLRQSCAKILAQPTNSSRIRDLVVQYEEYENEVTKHQITENELEQVLAERATCSKCGRKL
jgi:hypothetical protein